MRTIEGKSNIKATVICDSVSEAGIRLTTFELEYPRIIHSELMTHRMFSRNAASSRAIPFEKMLQQLEGKPVRFGAANKGMQDKGEEHPAEVRGPCYSGTAEEVWGDARQEMEVFALAFKDAGYHKQVYNRLLEPFQMMKTVVTATEWNNFFWLRDDDAADPTIRELAVCMKQAVEESVPTLLKAGEWHLPYVEILQSKDGCETYYYLNEKDIGTTGHISLEQAVKVSSARCAAVSFRNEDYGLDKCLEVYERLVGSEKKHSSALEHQATPMLIPCCGDYSYDRNLWEYGITHMDKQGNLWSGNLRGFIQYRQLISGHVVPG